jgi:hypothetical protein
MSSIRIAFFGVVAFIALPAAAIGSPARVSASRLFTVVNATFDTATALAIAPAGSGDFATIPLDPPLQGGRNDATVRLPAGDCLRDIRVTFRNGAAMTFPGIDVCRGSGLRLESGRRD